MSKTRDTLDRMITKIIGVFGYKGKRRIEKRIFIVFCVVIENT